ncbi:MAG TPA: PKD domain-containing protein, partial [Solirubrobacteraceae bacterium]|nr:PKD domain-containing protein [Solirubrobacteraceae bacterium]
TTHAEFPVVFTGDKSISAGPGSISYHWDFGDGASSSSADPSHTYMLAGTYTATLAVTYGEAPHTEDQSSVKVTVLPETAQEEKERQEEKEHLEEEERQEAKERKEAKERQEAKERAEATERQRAKEHQEAKEREEKERVLVESTILSGVSLAPIRFRVARAAVLRKASGKGKSAVGATLRFNLSQGGSVTSTFSRKVHAVKGFIYKSVASRGVVSVCTGSARAHTRKCRAPSSNRIAVTAVKGANTQVLSGWVGGVALPPGAYSVTVQAVGVDMTVSAPVVVHFVVLASAKG